LSSRDDCDNFRPVERFAKLRVPVLQADGAAAGPVTAPPPAIVGVATLLTGQVLRDGEIVTLILKPSRWWIVLSCLPWTTAILIAALGAHLANPRYTHVYVEAAAFAIAARAMWATLHWMGRLYVLTDQRIIRLSGVFWAEIFECPLRKVSRTRLIPTFRERVLRLGSIEISAEDEDKPCAVWQTIKKPAEVQERIQRAIRRAKQGGCLW